MWNLWHRLFGWHYVQYRVSTFQSINRLKVSVIGERYIVRLDSTLFMKPDGTFYNDNGKWHPLTWREE